MSDAGGASPPAPPAGQQYFDDVIAFRQEPDGQLTSIRYEDLLGRNDFKRIAALGLEKSESQTARPVPANLDAVGTRANLLVNIIYKRLGDDPNRGYLTYLTCSLAHIGAVGPNPDPAAAAAGFDRIEVLLVQSMRKLRRAYIYNLFGTFSTIVFVASLLYAALQIAVPHPGEIDIELLGDTAVSDIIRLQIATVIGIALSVLCSGILHNRVMTLSQLEHFDPNGFSTYERVLNVWTIATILELLLYFEILVVGVGGYQLTKPLENPEMGLVIGVVVGLATETYGQLVTGRAAPNPEKKS